MATWADESTNGYDLTANQTPTAATGKFGNCVSLDNGASPDYLSIASCPNIDWGGTYGDEPIGDLWFWFKGPGPASLVENFVVMVGSNTVRMTADGFIEVRIKRGDANVWSNTTSVVDYGDDGWHFFYMTLEGATHAAVGDLFLNVWIDNNLMLDSLHDDNNNVIAATTSLFIGTSVANKSWNGEIDDLGITVGANPGGVSTFRDALWNGGDGKSTKDYYASNYPATQEGYWRLEGSGASPNFFSNPLKHRGRLSDNIMERIPA